MLIDSHGLLTIRQAAGVLDTHHTCVYRWMRQRHFRVVFVGGHRFLTLDSVLQFQAHQREPKRKLRRL